MIQTPDYAHIQECFERGDKYREIQAATGLPMGTVKTVIRRLRLEGLVDYRYDMWADETVT